MAMNTVDFVCLVGLPGSGKSYMAERLMAEHEKKGSPCVIVSSDAIRGELFVDETCQDNPAIVFEEMKKRALMALENGTSVIYDATNLSRKRRMGLLKSIPASIVCIKRCVIVWAKLDTCIQRDAKRERIVGEKVIMKMVKQFQTPWYDEGWE